MTMYKNSSILRYFEPFTQPHRPNKRSLPEDTSAEPRAFRRSRSTTPKKTQSKNVQVQEEEHLEQGINRTSSSRKSLRPHDEEPNHSAIPTQVFEDESSHTPHTATVSDPLSRNPDILGSQCTSLMSSQRKVKKNGEVVITNSDDEPDSDSSLEDLDRMLLLGGQGIRGESSCPESQLPASSLNRTAEDGRRMSTRHKNKTDGVAVPFPSALHAQPKKYKFDLESLARHRKQEEASIEDITRASAMVRSFEQKASASGNAGAASTKGPLDTTFIDTVMKEHGDKDEISRLKAAIQRTEALHHGKCWFFFYEQAKEAILGQPDFPDVKDDRLGLVLRKTFSRQQAFLSGYVGEFAMKERLPEEILLWIIDAICLESRDDLRYSYTATLTDVSKDLASVLSPKCIDMLFRRLGATAVALQVEEPVIPRPALSQSTEAISRPNVLSILDLFQKSACILGSDTRMHLVCILCRLVLDHSIANNCRIMRAVEDALESLIESIPEPDLDHEVGIQTDNGRTRLTKF